MEANKDINQNNLWHKYLTNLKTTKFTIKKKKNQPKEN